ncbi:hypothetical protein [Sporosarcina sp. SAFN-015]|uniref:hypothetical protein n=1 Tax=Sporosarcina sp. SAFN-015 TaxID=3387274 RepID=UPI003F7F06DA
MSIVKVAYEMCKTILKNSSFRDEVSSMMSELNKFQDVKIGERLDQYEFGKIIRNQSAEKANIQFYGYLVADSQRKEIEKQFNCLVPQLTKEQYGLLTKLHREIIYINEKIINLLPNNLNHRSILDPYSIYEKVVTKEHSYDSLIFTDEILESLQLHFKKHKGFQEIGEIPSGLHSELNKISSKNIENIIFLFTDRIRKAGVMHSPDDILEAIENAKRDKTIIPLKYFISLMCIRESIQTLNQLIYQSFFQSKLPIYNEDNLISIRSASHLVGNGYSLKSQQIYNLNPIDLVHVFDPYDTEPAPTLCQIENISTSFNNKFGSHADLKLRVIDEDLNPFFGTLESINHKFL